MKRIISLLLAISLIAGIFIGCSFGNITIEEDMAYRHIGGYLYTSTIRPDTKIEKTSLLERKKAIDGFVAEMEKAAKKAFSLMSAIQDFEDNLIDYIDKCEPADNDDSTTLEKIAEDIMVERVKTESLKNEIQNYIDMKSGDPASEALIRTYANDALCSLIILQNKHIQAIKRYNASIWSILDKTDSRRADRLTASCDSIYEKKITKALIDTFDTFETASLIHSYIISGDYQLSRFYFEKASSDIDSLESLISAEQVSELKYAIENMGTSLTEPSVMKEIEEVESRELPSLTRIVSAYDDEAFFLASIAANFYSEAKRIFKKRNIRYIPSTTVSPTSDSASVNSVNISKDAQFNIDKTAQVARNREKAISIIGMGQSTLELTGLFMTTDEKYFKILEQVTGLLLNGKNPLSEEKRMQAVNLVKENVNRLIGDKRDEFVNKLTSKAASDIYDTFMEWKSNIKNLEDHDFTVEDMKKLLIGFGIEVSDITDNKEPLPSENPRPSNTVVKGSLPSADDYIEPRILLTYQEIKDIDQTSDNESVLHSVLGWIDPLDYSILDKKEVLDNNGNVTREYYVYTQTDGSEHPVGWDIEYRTEAVFYEYKFPDDMNRYMRIIRDIPSASDRFVSLEIEDSDLSRHVAFMFNNPDEAKKIHFISESTDNKKDGLNASQTSVGESYSYWEDGREMFSRASNKDGVLVRFKQYEYDNDKVYEDIWTYYENGSPRTEEHYIDGKYDGPYILYAEDGSFKMKAEYEKGLKNGTYEEYYDSGRLRRIRTYVDDKLYGDYKKFYDNDANRLSVSGYYVNDLKNGTWLEFDEEGNPVSEIEYLNDVLDGTYVVYGNRYGQYDNGEIHGIWYYGDSPEAWREMVSYDKGIKIWNQHTGSQTRTYFNPDGSINRRETVGD